MSDALLVSIVIPAFKIAYFAEALASACAQTYPSIEIVVCDDSCAPGIDEIVRAQQSRTAVPIRYRRNVSHRGELYNAIDGIELATGHYLKFLHDDDRLHPQCVARLVAAMEQTPGVALASCRRQRIGPDNEALPDILQTSYPFASDVIINGKELVSFFGDHTLNFIGEPSCMLCRRQDLLAFGEELMSINGCLIMWVGDLAMCAKLMQGGDIALLNSTLTDFRVSRLQGSQDGRDQVGIGDRGHADFRRTIREMGWYRASDTPRLVSVAPLAHPAAVTPVDLLAMLHAAFKRRQTAHLVEQWTAWRVPTPTQQNRIHERLAQAERIPLIEIIVIDLIHDEPALQRTLDSLDRVRAYYPAMQALVLRDRAHVNSMIGQSDAQWIMLAAAGDELLPGGLLVAGLELLPQPDCRAVFCDETLRMPDGDLVVRLRPDFNLDYLLSFPSAMEHHWLFRRDVLIEAGGFDNEFASAMEFEFILRLITQGGMASLGHIHEPLIITPARALHDSQPHREALGRHLLQRGYDHASVNSPRPGQYHIDYGHTEYPQVSIVLVMRDELAAVQRCVMSVLEKTRYAHYELVIVDNASRQADSKAWLKAIEQLAPDRIRLLRLEKPLARSAACNLGARQARGEYLLWLRPHVAVLDDGWMNEMLNHALRQEVAIVGAKTVSGEGMVTHAGLILGLNGAVAPAFSGERMDAPGYMSRLQVDQNYSAVSDACLMIRKTLFDEVEGFDAQAFSDQGADMDLCLRVGALGYLIVWAARTLLLHSQQSMVLPEVAQTAAYERWLPLLSRDPAYNLNLTLHNEQSFDLVDSRISWRPLSWRPLPVVMAHPADPYGAGHYRMIQPFNGLKQRAQIEGVLCDALLHPADLARYSPDAIVMQRPVGEHQLPMLRGMKAFSKAFKVFELDDYLPNLPLKSVHRGNFPKDVLRSIRRGLDCVDRLVVSTEPLAQAFKGMHGDIKVVPNRLDLGWWGNLGETPQRSVDQRKPRVGWVGGYGHEGDLAIILDVVKALADEVDWVFFGGAPEYLRPYAKEMHPGVDIAHYPARLSRLDLDLAVAPLEHNLFNECKSNLRLLEYGICGYPVVCSDIAPYRGGLPVTLVKNRYKDWLDAIRLHLAEHDATREQGMRLQAAVRRDWMLDDTALDHWRSAWLGDS